MPRMNILNAPAEQGEGRTVDAQDAVSNSTANSSPL
jgi:hypothetical protein